LVRASECNAETFRDRLLGLGPGVSGAEVAVGPFLGELAGLGEHDRLSGGLGGGGHVGGAGVGEGEGVDLLVEFFADPFGDRGWFEGEVVVDGVVGNG
jgi:hypothetical protein